MSVQSHRHCQATVLGATGDPHGAGKTWHKINGLDLPQLREDWKTMFSGNDDITDDISDILKLIDWLSLRIKQLQSRNQSSLPGDLIDVGTDGKTISVKNDIPESYDGLVGITSGANRHLTPKRFRVTTYFDETYPLIATIKVKDDTYEIHAPIGSGQITSDNLITEDGIDIALCDGNDTLISITDTAYEPDEPEPEDDYVSILTEDGVRLFDETGTFMIEEK